MFSYSLAQGQLIHQETYDSCDFHVFSLVLYSQGKHIFKDAQIENGSTQNCQKSFLMYIVQHMKGIF